MGSPVGRRAFGLTLAAAVATAGWLGSSLTLAAAFGASWLPGPPPIPAALILPGLTVGLDPGHGGYDPGVLLNEGQPDEIRECDLNLAVALKLRDLLERAGARVVMTRTEDRDLIKPGEGAAEELSNRAKIMLDAQVDVFVSLHCNSFGQSQWRGSQTFYVANGVPGSKELGEMVQAELARVTRETDREANGRQDLFILKQMRCPAIIVELGFMSNPRDLQLLQNPDYQHLLALAIFFGLCRFARQAPVGPA